MCREDVRIGRMKTSAARLVTLSNASAGILVGAAKNRTHLRVCCARDEAVIFLTGSTDDITRGEHLSATLPSVDIDIETHGNAVTQSWSGAGIAAPCTLYVIETFFDDGVYP